MAANFKIGDQVKLIVTVPEGPITQMLITQDGEIQYLVEWVDADSTHQSRWFKEAELVKV